MLHDYTADSEMRLIEKQWGRVGVFGATREREKRKELGEAEM